MSQIKKILKSPGCKKIPIVVRNEDDVVVCARNFVSDRICPIFCVSNVTGDNLDHLRKFLNLLPRRTDWDKTFDKPAEFHIDATWSVQVSLEDARYQCLSGSGNGGIWYHRVW